jgi:DNA polymerase/3'-5' exonuclease PolX
MCEPPKLSTCLNWPARLPSGCVNSMRKPPPDNNTIGPQIVVWSHQTCNMETDALCLIGTSIVNEHACCPLPTTASEAAAYGRNNAAGGDTRVSRKAVRIWYDYHKDEIVVERIGASEAWIAVSENSVKPSEAVASLIPLAPGVSTRANPSSVLHLVKGEITCCFAYRKKSEVPSRSRYPSQSQTLTQPASAEVYHRSPHDEEVRVSSAAKRRRTLHGAEMLAAGALQAGLKPFQNIHITILKAGPSISSVKLGIWKRSVESLGGELQETQQPFDLLSYKKDESMQARSPSGCRVIILLDEALTLNKLKALKCHIPDDFQHVAAHLKVELHSPRWLISSLEAHKPLPSKDLTWEPAVEIKLEAATEAKSALTPAASLLTKSAFLKQAASSQLARLASRTLSTLPPSRAHEEVNPFSDTVDHFYPRSAHSEIVQKSKPFISEHPPIKYDASALPIVERPAGCYQWDRGSVPAEYTPWLYSLGDELARVGTTEGIPPLPCPFSAADITRINAGIMKTAPWLTLAIPTEETSDVHAKLPPPPVSERPMINPYGLVYRPNYNSHVTDALAPLLSVYHSMPNTVSEDYTIKHKQLEAAVGMISCLGKKLETADDLKGLPTLEAKTITKVDEILRSGDLGRATSYNTDVRANTLREFCKVHSIGPTEAQRLYDAGARTLEDLREKYFHLLKPQARGNLKYVEACGSRVTREESDTVEEIVSHHLYAINPGSLCRTVGSYRRGKPTSADIDLFVGVPSNQLPAKIMEALHAALWSAGLLKDDLHWGARSESDGVMHDVTFRRDKDVDSSSGAEDVQGPESGLLMGTGFENSASILYLGVCIMPGTKDTLRRIDIKCVRLHQMPAALLQWTGNIVFNRTLRHYAHGLGLDLNELGIYHRATRQALAVGAVRHHVEMKGVPLRSEFDIFSYLGLHYIPPEQRNCADLSCAFPA